MASMACLRPRPLALSHCSRLVVTVAVVSAAASSSIIGGQVGSSECRNPLFQTHWAGKSDIRHVAAVPTLQYYLKRCPMYNGRKACCTSAFESEMDEAFERWKKHWQGKRDQITDFQKELTKVKVSPSYTRADKSTQVILDKALMSFGPVLETYGTCFDTLLEFMAGMLCFSCEPSWNASVVLSLDGLRVKHLKLHDSTSEELWASCSVLSTQMQEMRTRAQDSLLAKGIHAPFPELDMFESRISVTEYMAENGLIPLRGPNEKVLVVREGTAVRPSRLLAASQAVTPGDSIAVASPGSGSTLHPIRDGRLSGFHCAIFPRMPLQLVPSRTVLPDSYLAMVVVIVVALVV